MVRLSLHMCSGSAGSARRLVARARQAVLCVMKRRCELARSRRLVTPTLCQYSWVLCRCVASPGRVCSTQHTTCSARRAKRIRHTTFHVQHTRCNLSTTRTHGACMRWAARITCSRSAVRVALSSSPSSKLACTREPQQSLLSHGDAVHNAISARERVCAVKFGSPGSSVSIEASLHA